MISSALFVMLATTAARAQGVQGIVAAESSLLAYVDPVASLCLVIGAVVADRRRKSLHQMEFR